MYLPMLLRAVWYTVSFVFKAWISENKAFLHKKCNFGGKVGNFSIMSTVRRAMLANVELDIQDIACKISDVASNQVGRLIMVSSFK